MHEVRKEMLSDYQLQLIKKKKRKPYSFGKNKNLIPNLRNKKKIQTPLSKRKTLVKFRATIKKNSYIIRIQTGTFFKHTY